jgi:uncharacterized protein
MVLLCGRSGPRGTRVGCGTAQARPSCGVSPAWNTGPVSDTDSLTALLDADRWIDKARIHLERLAEKQELSDVEAQIRVLATEMRDLESQRGPARTAFETATEHAEVLRQRRRHLDEQLNHATVPARDLASMQGELAKVTSAMSAAEDDEVAGLLALEPLDNTDTEIRSRAEPLIARRKELQSTIEALLETGNEELAHLVAARGPLADALSSPLRQRYDIALKHAGVSGAAHLVDGRCDGCRVTLSALDISRARALPLDQFADCPHCGRLLLC